MTTNTTVREMNPSPGMTLLMIGGVALGGWALWSIFTPAPQKKAKKKSTTPPQVELPATKTPSKPSKKKPTPAKKKTPTEPAPTGPVQEGVYKGARIEISPGLFGATHIEIYDNGTRVHVAEQFFPDEATAMVYAKNWIDQNFVAQS